jgi:hypothetical protein
LLYKVLTDKLENALIYIGYGIGILLVLEDLVKLVKGLYMEGLLALLYAGIFWFFGKLIRKAIYKRKGYDFVPLVKRLPGWRSKTEFLYFLFSYIFISVFSTTLLKFTTLTVTAQPMLVTLVSHDLIYTLFFHTLVFIIYISFLLLASKFLFIFFIRKTGNYAGSSASSNMPWLIIFITLVIASIAAFQTPFIASILNEIQTNAIAYLKENFQWAADMVIGAPVLYYAYASFKGPEAVESFFIPRS